MAKERTRLDFRFYDMPQTNSILIFSGEKWKRPYGKGAPNLHFHNVLEVGICREGEGMMLYEGAKIPYRAGMLSIIPRNVPHNTMNEPEAISWWEYLFIDVHWYMDWAYGDNPQLAQKTEERINARANLVQSELWPEIVNAIDGIILEKNNRQHYSAELINAMVFVLLLNIARMNRDYTQSQDEETRNNIRHMKEVLRFIDVHYAETLSVADLAGIVSLSETHFRRIFKESVNMSPTDYLNMIRIQHACSMLQKTDYPVEIIAEKCGFTTLSTFNRNFRTFMDESPLKWKKAHVLHGDESGGFRVKALKGWDDDTR